MEEQENQLIQQLKQNELDAYYGIMTIGPSGSGKSTFCHGLSQFFDQINRKYIVINLDPANDQLQYKCGIDIRDLIQLDDVMEEFQLGPNGGLLYCMDFLDKNIQWLLDEIQNFKDHFLIFDLPGQIELYLNSSSMRNIIESLQYYEKFTCQLVLAELFDSHYCYDKYLFSSVCLQALTSIMNLELPHINIISKIDLMKQLGRPELSLEQYFSPYELGYLFEPTDSKSGEEETQFDKKYKNIHAKIYETVEDENLLSFYPCDIQNKLLVSNLISMFDKANGFQYSQYKKEEKYEYIRNDISKTNEIYGNQYVRDLEDELFQDVEQEQLIESQSDDIKFQKQQQQSSVVNKQDKINDNENIVDQILAEKQQKQQQYDQPTIKTETQNKKNQFGGFKKGFFN